MGGVPGSPVLRASDVDVSLSPQVPPVPAGEPPAPRLPHQLLHPAGAARHGPARRHRAVPDPHGVSRGSGWGAPPPPTMAAPRGSASAGRGFAEAVQALRRGRRPASPRMLLCLLLPGRGPNPQGCPPQRPEPQSSRDLQYWGRSLSVTHPAGSASEPQGGPGWLELRGGCRRPECPTHLQCRRMGPATALRGGSRRREARPGSLQPGGTRRPSLPLGAVPGSAASRPAEPGPRQGQRN